MDLDIWIILVVSFTSIIQSLFGVGILLFGTPLLILLDYKFVELLNILLPISLSLNFFQIQKDASHINKEFFSKFVLLVVPSIAVTLNFGLSLDLNFKKFIGVFLIIIAISSYFKILNPKLIVNKFYLIFMGIFHGLTNLGGSLLTAYVGAMKLNKIETRTNIAICYFIFALTQLIVLNVNDLFLFSYENFVYILISILIFTFVNNKIFIKINDNSFSKMVAFLLFIFGIMALI